MRNIIKKYLYGIALAVLVFSGVIIGAAGCGGGGGRSAALSQGIPSRLPPWYLPSLDQIVRTTADFDNVTYYLPTPSSWYLFDATAKYNWISAIGTTAGLSASMTNPFKEVGILLLPKSMYANPGQAIFYLDGEQAGTLDMSAAEPFEGYKSDFVSYYKIASDLTETTHTVTIEIATGSIGIDGWRMFYKDQQYDIDCSQVNTLETDTISESEKLRDAVESYADEFNSYPDPGASNLISFLKTAGISFSSDPTNPFTHNTMADSSEYSAGDYHYTFSATSSYTLDSYGGSGTLLSLTENSAETNLLHLSLTSPANHITTAAAYVNFSGTAEDTGTDDWGAAYISICCGLNGETRFPATGTFSINILLREGVNNLIAALINPFGNQIILDRTIRKDTTAPTIILLDPFPLAGPVGAQYYVSRTTPVAVRAYVEKGSSAVLNGSAMTVDSQGVFNYSMALTPGDNTITITASDGFNPPNTATYMIVYSP